MSTKARQIEAVKALEALYRDSSDAAGDALTPHQVIDFHLHRLRLYFGEFEVEPKLLRFWQKKRGENHSIGKLIKILDDIADRFAADVRTLESEPE